MAGRGEPPIEQAELERLFPGDSEMAGRMRCFDWAQSELGSLQFWPQNLRLAVSLCLTSRFPILLWWGQNWVVLYNDAYIPFLGETKHPRALAMAGREVWGEIWDPIGPMLEGVRATSQATCAEDFQFFFDRKLPREEVHVRFTYGPILSADGRTVDGIFCPCTEITAEIVAARRLETLRKLGARGGETRTVEEACRLAAAVLGDSPHDIPFTAIYVTTGEDTQLARSVVLPSQGDHLLPASVSVSDADAPAPWPLAKVLRTKRPVDCMDLPGSGIRLRSVAWPDEVNEAIVLPIHASQDELAGLLVVGVSPRRPLDTEYRAFFDLIAAQIATAIADARAYEGERKRAEALAELDRAKTAFFSNVSHEFRTPLTLMLGPVQDALADETEPLEPRHRQRLETVHRNSLRLLKLVNTLLDFSRIEAGRMRAVYEPVDLAALTSELVSSFESACERAHLRLMVDCPPIGQPVYVDRDMWEKVVLNLVSNAIKFTLEGEIAVNLHPAGREVELGVRDTGTGIPPHELPHLFERFHRVEGAGGRTHEGTGIGLALVQELVKLHGGSVRVASTPGRGSHFVVSIPLGKGHLPADRIGATPTLASTRSGANAYLEEALRWLPDELSAQKSPGKRPRIVWADDNADMREYVRRLLSDRYDVEPVSDGQAALAAARANPPDLVLTDGMMPLLDGFGLLNALRADPATRTIPVILLSARAGEESRVKGLEAGADDYLIKPFGARELLARVGAHVEMNRVRQEAFRREQVLREEAQQVRHRLASVLQGISDGFIALDRDWRYTALNDKACESMGLACPEVLGKCIWDIYPDTLDTPFGSELRRAAREKRPVNFEFYYAARKRWYENRVYPREDGVSIFFADITERKQVEAALRHSEEGFRRYFELGLIGMAITSPTKGCLEVNDEICRILGYERGELLTKTWAEMTHPDDLAADFAHFERVMAGEIGGYTLDKRWIRKDGHVIDTTISVQCLRAADGSVDCFVALLQDVTERKRAEAALRRSEKLLAADLAAMSRVQEVSTRLVREGDSHSLLLSIVDAAIAITSADMGNIRLLDHASGTFKIVANRDMGDRFLDYFGATEEGRWACGAAMLSGQRVIVEDVLTSPLFANTPARDVLIQSAIRGLQCTPLVGRSGQIVGMLSTHYHDPRTPGDRELPLLDLLARQAADWVERTESQSAVNRAKEAAERANQLKDEFLATVSHELRSPLTGILLWSELLEGQQLSAEDTVDALKTVRQSAQSLQQLIEDLLDVSRTLAGEMRMNLHEIELNDVVGSALNILRPAAEAKKIRLEADIRARLPKVLADPARMQQVTLNLLNNAVKFSSEGGRVDVRLSCEDGKVKLTVTDTGKGIGPDFLPHIFERFRQAERNTSGGKGGLGLGLTIARELIQLHNGAIHAESPGIGRGSTFTVILPVNRRPAEDAPMRPVPESDPDDWRFVPSPVFRGRRALVVEDDPASMEVIQYLLEKCEAEVTAVDNAAAALAEFLRRRNDRPFDFVVSDVALPQMNGQELIRQVRAAERGSGASERVPAVALSAYTRDRDRAEAMSAGFDAYLGKPLRANLLVKTVTDLLQTSGGEDIRDGPEGPFG